MDRTYYPALQIPEIVENILKHMHLNDLHNSLMVNNLWKSESSKKILQKFYISTPPSFYHEFFDVTHNKTNSENNSGLKNQCKKEFKKKYGYSHWNRNKSYNEFQKYFFNDHNHKCALALDEQRRQQYWLTSSLRNLISCEVKNLSLLVKDERDVNFYIASIPKDSVKEIKIDPKDARFHWTTDENVYKLLAHFTNLQILDISCLTLLPWGVSPQAEEKLETLLKTLERLRVIKLTPTIGNFQRQATLHKRLKQVQSLTMDRWNSIGIVSTFITSQIEWKISNLNFYLDVNLNVQLCQDFFNLICGSLKILKMEGLKSDDLQRSDNCDVLTCLANLETLEICLRDSNSLGRKKACGVAFKLPKLKKMVVPMDTFFDLPTIEPNFLNKCLQEIIIIDNGGFLSGEPKLNKNLCSNVTRLEMHLDLYWNFTTSILNLIFQNMGQLQQLELILTANFDWIEEEEIIESMPADWDEHFTGVKRRNNTNYRVNDAALGTIGNLQSLRGCIIKTDDARKLGTLISDQFIYKGLCKLNSLQLFHVPENYFSTNAMKHLKDLMGPWFNFYTKKGL